MDVLGSIFLTALIALGAGSYTRHVGRQVGPLVPEPARRLVPARLPSVPTLASARSLGRRALARVVIPGTSPWQPAPAGGTPAGSAKPDKPAGAATAPSRRPGGPALALVPASKPAPPQQPQEAPPVTTGTNQAPMGAGADMFTAVNTIITSARHGGIRSKARAVLLLSEGLETISQALIRLGHDLAEPSLRYPLAVCEPVGQAGAQAKAGGMACAESHAALMNILNRPVAEQLGQMPHHEELNKEA